MEDSKGYWCVVCGKYLLVGEDGIIAHEDAPHPGYMMFDEENNPQ